MSNMGNQLLANVFKALAHPTRLQIIQLLQNGPLCVCDILPQIEAEQSNTSQHLAVMRTQGILDNKKDGSMVIYRVKSLEVIEMIHLAEIMILRQMEETRLSIENK